MILFWEWKIKIKKVDYSSGAIDNLRKIYKQGLPRLKPPANFLKFVTAWSTKQAKEIPESVKTRVYAEIAECEKVLGYPFEEEVYKRKGCLAAAKLCSFINNIMFFNKTYLFVKPLQEEMEAATLLANTKQEELAVIEEKVALLVAQVKELEEEL